MRTARSLTVFPYLVVSHACPPPEQPHMPPKQPHMPPLGSNHACPPEQPRTPLEQPRTPWSNHACPPGAITHAPWATTNAPSPSGATTHAPRATMHTPPRGQNVDTRFWKYYFAPTSLRAVTKNFSPPQSANAQYGISLTNGPKDISHWTKSKENAMR